MLEYEPKQATERHGWARWQLSLFVLATAVLAAVFACGWYGADFLGSGVTSVAVALGTWIAAFASLWASRAPKPYDEEANTSSFVRLFGTWVMWGGLAMAVLDTQVAHWADWLCVGAIVARYLVVVIIPARFQTPATVKDRFPYQLPPTPPSI